VCICFAWVSGNLGALMWFWWYFGVFGWFFGKHAGFGFGII